MSDKFPLATAAKFGAKIVAEIAPFCERVEVAGSVRRQKAEVKDLEIVVVPTWEERPDPADLFQESRLRVNLLCENLSARDQVRWIKPSTSEIQDWPLKPEGKYWRGLLANGMKLDMFIANAANYGLIKLIRTGSAEFNVALFAYGNRNGSSCVNGRLWSGLKFVDTPEETDVFNILGLRYVEPHDRVDGRAVRPR